MRKLALLVALGALAPVALVACGGGDDESSTTAAAPTTSTTAAGGGGGGGATVKFSAPASGDLKFDQTSVSTKAGNDTIDFDNPSSIPHNVTIEDSSGNEIAATDTISGDTTSTTADLKPGTYTFLCSVDGHEAAGMKGTLTVK